MVTVVGLLSRARIRRWHLGPGGQGLRLAAGRGPAASYTAEEGQRVPHKAVEGPYSVCRSCGRGSR
jgi:hypothetical protein